MSGRVRKTYKDQVFCHVVLDKSKKWLELGNVISSRLEGNCQQAEAHVDHNVGVVCVVGVDKWHEKSQKLTDTRQTVWRRWNSLVGSYAW